jgi:hypothetical protein
MTISNSLENLWLDTLDGAGDTYSASATYLQLHTGNPGEDCTASVASESTRQAVTFGAAAAGSKASNASVVWTNVAATEVYTHWSMWDSETDMGSNVALWYGQLSSNASVTAGDTFEITSLTLTLD